MTTSVLIVGAGIVGCSAAHYLAARGVSVTVLDAGAIGGQASTQTAGNLHFQLSYTAMKGSKAEFEQHTKILELNLDANRRWRELATDFSGAIDITQNGGVVVAETDGDRDALRQKSELERRAGFTTTYLDREELAERVPEVSDTIVGGSWHADEGWVNARTVCYELARRAEFDGAQFVLNSFVTGIRRRGGSWAVRAGDRSFVADTIIVAAGAWTQKVAALADAVVPMHASALTMSVSNSSPPIMSRLVMHASRPLSLKQVSSGNVMIGGGRRATLLEAASPLGWSTEPVLESIVGGIDDCGRVVPAARGLSVIRSWQGLLGSPADEIPVIGEVPGRPGMIVAVAGHTGYTLGPSCGWAAAQIAMRERTDVDAARFTPSRFAGASA
ncbi:NAD(P)/FAD-dependent oxidoreductase [Subtercola endophyticus]|uniref:NAD(P)/FAD-dependent oxidoreductase n=1 Tax=Subtercola endophyticus TaxID=2895559 RepID=UPI001E4563FF|nr:FAD-dependent oxidoreductase [Subtercola endophyticus]UFS58253.1 FAD-binding oxidoreductase [Subtercola endophyticus]